MKSEKAAKRILENGLEIVYLRSPSVPVIAIDLWVRSGSTSETKEEAGLAHVVEHMLFKGTKRRGPGVIAGEVEGLGGEINAYTSFDHTVYTLLLASRYAPQGLDILADAISASLFDQSELDMEKKVILEEIKRSRDIPQLLLSRNLFKLAYGSHPYGAPVIGNEETVSSFTSKDCRRFVGKWYTPCNMTLVAVGDLPEEKFFALAESAFRHLRPSPVCRRRRLPKKVSREGHRFEAENRPVCEVYFDLAFPIPGAGNEVIPAIDLLASILGQGESSRLQEKVKLDLNLVASVGAGTYTPSGPGLLYLTGVASPAKFTEAFEAICRELAQIKRSAPSLEELRKAKEGIEADFIFQRETVQGLAQKMGYFHVVHGSTAEEEKYLASIEAMDLDRLGAHASGYLNPAKATFAALCPAAEDSSAIAKEAEKVLFSAFSRKTGRQKRSTEVRIELQNGAKVLYRRGTDAPIVAVRASMLGGTIREPEGKEGLFYLLAETMPRGTRRRSVFDVARESDRIGGHIDGFSGRNSFGAKGEFLAKNADAALDLLCDVLINPSFSEEEVEKAKEDQQASILRRDDNPASKAFRSFENLLYGKHPYGKDVLGSLASLSSLGAEDLRGVHALYAHPANMAIALVGEIDPERAALKISDALEVSSLAGKLPLLPAQPENLWEPRFLKISSPFEQAHVVVGFLGSSLYDRDRMALRVLNAMLSGQGGRLFRSLRDEKGLAYAVTSTSMEGLQRGYLAGYIATAPENAEAAREGLLEEMLAVAEGNIPAEEVERAKQKLAGSFEINLQENDFQAAQMALDESYGLDYRGYLNYVREILAVTPAQVAKVAKKYLGRDNWAAVIVGP
ncbi:insulinase family protein [bacterium]|nr:MAG: insulinase family protein [bacterium]